METKKFLQSIKYPLLIVTAMWIFHIIYVITESRLGLIGVYPRNFKGIIGIFASPFLHGDWKHLISNSVPLLVLMTIIFSFYKKVAAQSIILIYLFTGLAVWLFAREVIHIGASGVVYGLVSFVFWNGIFRRNLKSIILALIVTILYSGYFLGILPNQEGISWESHLFGGIVGIFISYFLKDKAEEEDKIDPWADERTDQDKYFLDRNAFDKTKMQKLGETAQGGWTSDDTLS